MIEHILLITMLTIKILFPINSLKKTISSKHYNNNNNDNNNLIILSLYGAFRV